MPGILPMKVIKVGSNAQTRIAQACDRCRSKKIRCDGVRPSCTQCVNVGFECKTSDKLSRRAFPRGYTESLEERVRALEAEVRELKDLLDEKDEKIDMLTRIHSNSPHTPHTTITRSASSQSPVASIENKDEPIDKEDVFKVQQSPLLLDDENCDSYFMGLSSGRTLVDAFKRKVQETGKPCSDIHPETFFHPGPRASISSQNQQGRIVSFKAPPRLVSDQLINIFFQEWAPLFPVLHRPTFLTLYEEYIANPEAMEDKKSLAQLNLVFSIAALSSASRVNQDVDSFEAQWHAAIECILMENSMAALQCLVLAQISCLLSADYPRLLKYKGLAIGLSHRLGLHQSQKRFALGALTAETRKKVFWTLYVVDCFSAAQLGNPRMLKEEDVHCEYPVDADDEYVTEKGFLPTLPGESTKLSSALALFRASRILGKLLTDIYPASTSAELSFRALTSLAEELDSWLENLAPHLRLQFAQDKPSTNVISSRSPLLSLMYHYIRTLIYRPAVCANLGDRASSATLALAGSSKHIVQILQLLEERGLSFTFAVNKNELLLVCGFGLLFQTFDADQEGKLYKDCQRMVAAIVELLDRARAPCGPAFRRIGCHMLAPPQGDKRPTPAPAARHNSEGTMPAPSDTAFRATQKHLKAIAQCFSPAMARFSKSDSSALKEPRRATVPNITPGFGMHGNQSSVSLSSIRSEPAIARSEPTLSPHPQRSSLTPRSKKANLNRQQNLDYLAFDAAAIPAAYQLPASLSAMKSEVSSSDWERLLGSLDNGHTNIYDTIYGGQTADALVDVPPLSASSDSRIAWSPEMWNLGLGLGSTEHFHQGAAPPQSVLSFSDESLTSGEEFPCDFPSVGSDHSLERSYPGIVMPELSPLGGLDGNFGL